MIVEKAIVYTFLILIIILQTVNIRLTKEGVTNIPEIIYYTEKECRFV